MRFRPFEEEGTPIEDQFMNWNSMIRPPYNKNSVDAYTRARVILMNGIENNSILMSHAVARMTDNDEIKRQLALIRRVDSQQQQTVNWLTPADQTVLETTLGYEQLAVDLTANLARNEEDSYFKQVLDFALIEDFDHLFRYGKLMERLEGKDPGSITQGKTDIKPGRPTVIEHRHPDDEMRMHFNKDEASAKTKMNYYTIVSAEQQTELFYKSHGFMYRNDLARKLYAEIAEIEEQHVSQYELIGDPNESPLEKMTLMQLNEAYNYYSCMQTEPDERIRKIWQDFFAAEITHFIMCYELMQKFENKDIGDVLKAEAIEPLIVLEPNKDYVNHIIDTQVDLQPYNMRFVRADKLPDDWKSFDYMTRVNAGEVPSEDVIKYAEKMAA
ncbi:MAG: hypothetical protein OIN66_04660 [Candidatus Methanoperedens sp.]|nr:hypothetical protein [Candidatus Methanoperedens sp.]